LKLKLIICCCCFGCDRCYLSTI